MSRRVVVTGLGVATPLGCEVETVWSRLLAGECGVAAPLRHGHDAPPTGAVGELDPDDLDQLQVDHPEAAATGEMRTLLGVAAGTQALRDAGLADGPAAKVLAGLEAAAQLVGSRRSLLGVLGQALEDERLQIGGDRPRQSPRGRLGGGVEVV